MGSGPNGLVAANLLADQGWDVLVLEAQPTYGGAVRSAEVCAPGYVTDLFSAFYPLAVASPVIARLGLEHHGLRWSHAPLPVLHLTPEGRTAFVSRNLDETAASLDSWAAGDGDAYRRVFAEWQRVREPLIDALFSPFPPVQPALRLAARLGTADSLRFARQAVMPVRRWTQENFAGEGAALLFAGNALHGDLTPDSAGGALFGWLLTMLAQDVGWPSPVGGAGRLADALVDRLRSRGAEVQCSTPVRRVLVEDGRATGVETADGTRIRAGRAVLADVAAPALYLELVGAEHLPARVRDDLRHFAWDDATVKVNWALRAPIPWTAREAARAGTVQLGVDMADLGYFAADLAAGRLPRKPFVLLGQMTTTDPTRSPAGTESVWAYTHVPQSAASSPDVLAAHVDKVEDLLEAAAPGFRALIVGRSVQLPGDLEAADANLVGGAINAGTAAIFQQLVFRPVPGLGRPETPVRGLYLASASAHPGGGVHGAPGANAARVAMRHAGIAGGLVTGAVGAARFLVQGDKS